MHKIENKNQSSENAAESYKKSVGGLTLFISILMTAVVTSFFVGASIYRWSTSKKIIQEIPRQRASVTFSPVITNNMSTTTSVFPSPFLMFSCTPKSQDVILNQPVTITEDSFEGQFQATWNAPGGNPETDSGRSFTTTFTTEGEKIITATSIDYPGEQRTDTCRVTVHPPF